MTMNIALLIIKLIRKIPHVFNQISYYFIKKPLYNYAFNSNGNRYICKGYQERTNISICGSGHYIEIGGVF